MERLKGKTGLVIGAGTVGGGWGNGKACAVQYAREGARVVCFDLDAALAEETAAIIRGEGGEAIAFGGNAASWTDVKAAVDLTVSRFGALNLLLNNVGIVIGGGVVELSEDNWDKMFAVNFEKRLFVDETRHPNHGRRRRRLDRQHLLDLGHPISRQKLCRLLHDQGRA